MTLEQLIERTAQRFKAARLRYGHGTDNAHDEAAFLVLRGLKLPFSTDLAREADERRIAPLVKKRIAQRIPAAYLLNEAWLDGLRFYVDRRVIVPRSHIAFLLKDLRVAPKRILDLCTGSGCLAILAARAFPKAKVDASDVSSAALAVAARNVREHRLGRRVRLIRSDLFSELNERYDLIISNPPYVSTPAMRKLPPEYRYEPGIALAAGAQGLDFVARILEGAPAHLEPRGLLVCEIGENRKALERAYPEIAFHWPQDEVFKLTRARIPSASRAAARPRRAA
ncbi:MAG TPA: 50S ribosomal protein L3 N(5)-glutamine methyltransferase [Burkholderiales bacterium]|nr:50S ribosomal protein L3 N(5)-glutamine methyltransferase [Burkholderiales bacterium]